MSAIQGVESRQVAVNDCVDKLAVPARVIVPGSLFWGPHRGIATEEPGSDATVGEAASGPSKASVVSPSRGPR